ncbi:Tad domain-containing protein [Aliikangiella sp. IMCC44653]
MLNRDRQRGQSLILVSAFLGAISLVIFVAFNSGMLSKEKMQLQNTADAAAYSASVFAARDLNFKAYTNRAMVANHVAIGQYVGLSSWMEMMYNSTDNLATVTSWIPYVGAITNAIKQVMNAVNSVAQPVLEIATTFTNYVNIGISAGQKGFHFAMGIATIEMAKKVIDANDKDVSFGAISTALLTADTVDIWLNFSDNIDVDSNNRTDKARKKEFHDITNNSRDRFTKRRTYTWLSTPKIPFIPAFRIEKAGGSDLIESSQNDETWTAMDTVAIWQGNYKCKWFKCRWKWKEWLPSGWASARSGENFNMYSKSRDKIIWGETWKKNPNTSRFAASNLNEVGEYDGLQDFYDLKKEGHIEETPKLRVVVAKSANKIRTSKHAISDGANGKSVQLGAGRMNLEENAELAKDTMSAIGKAQAYFKRPNDISSMRRLDGQIEFGNLYSPYWYPRLIDSDNADRRIATILINQIFL